MEGQERATSTAKPDRNPAFSSDHLGIREPIAAKRETLAGGYDIDRELMVHGRRNFRNFESRSTDIPEPFRNSRQESIGLASVYRDQVSGIPDWNDHGVSRSSSSGPQDVLGRLFEPPFDIMFRGTIEEVWEVFN